VFAAMFAFAFMATTLSGRGYGHYYLQLVASSVLMGGWALAYVLRFIEENRHLARARAGLLIGMLVVIPAVDLPACRLFASRIATPATEGKTSEISREILKRTNGEGPIWAPDHTGVYAETGLLSPTKYQYAFPHLFKDTWKDTRRRKLRTLMNDLKNSPPRLIVLTEESAWLFSQPGFSTWLSENYRMIPGVWDELQVTVAERAQTD
jgi:hypothetical protein